MIIPVLKEITVNTLALPFGNGRKPMLNLEMKKGNFVWVYPVLESDKLDGSNSIGTSYDAIIGFFIPGKVEPGTEVEQSYIDQARAYCYTFEQKLARHDFVRSLSNIKREPFYGFMSEHFYGMNMRLTIVSRYPYAKC